VSETKETESPSAAGKTIVVTGGTGGIGLQTAIGLARAGAQVVITGRDRQRGEAALEVLRAHAGPADVHLALGDLSRRAEVRRLAEELRSRFPRIDVLINNAGSLATRRITTPDGLELDVAVNVAAPVLLTRALVPALAAAAPARVINVTGGMPFGGLDVDFLRAAKQGPGLAWYSMTKRALEAASLALADELAPRGIHVNVVYPGGASTQMTQAMTPSMLPWFMRPMWPLFRTIMADDGGRGAQKAARSSIWAATTAELEGVSGRYFDTECRPAKLHKTIRDPENQRQVLSLIEGSAPPVDAGVWAAHGGAR
jgi:NAD(P)-dependent dehydrogenase (short-subunit alcohol dehydrogenase family)